MSCKKRFFIMFYKCRFSIKSKKAFITFIHRNLTRKSNEVSRNAKVNFAFPFVECSAFNQVHKNMILFVLKAYKALNNGRIIDCCQLINFFGFVFKLCMPIKLPLIFYYLFCVRFSKPDYLSVKYLTCRGVLY